MKRTTKWMTLFLSLIVMTNSMVVSGASVPVLPVMEEAASDTAEVGATDEPTIGEEIVEWRDGENRHYYIGDGLYQVVVIAPELDDNIAMPAATAPNNNAVEDTYISSFNKTQKYGSSTNLLVSANETAFLYFQLPSLPDNADVQSANLYLTYSFSTSSGLFSIGAYPVTFYWSESSLTWNVANGYSNMGVGTQCIGTTTLSGSTSVRQAKVSITSAVKSWYESKDVTNCGIALKRKSGSIDSVTLKSSESENSSRPYMVVTYSLVNIPVDSGVYYIRNGEFHNLFMRTDNQGNDGDDTYSESGKNANDKFCELFDPFVTHSTSPIKWRIEYLHNGYYVIKNINENYCLAIRSGEENSDRKIIIRESFTGEKRQQWKITLLSNGAYKINPRSSESYSTDWVMAANDEGTASTLNSGQNVIQTAYNGSDSNSRDQWYIQSMNPIPRMSLTMTIDYDGLTAGITSTILSEFQTAADMLMMMYGIELKTPALTYNASITVDNSCHVANDVNSICDNICGPASSCSNMHHKSASNFYNETISHSQRVCRVVGFSLCGYNGSEHSDVQGRTASWAGNKEVVVTTQTPDGQNNYLDQTILHELAHTFGTDDHPYRQNEMCTMTDTMGCWCSTCYNAINEYVRNHMAE